MNNNYLDGRVIKLNDIYYVILDKNLEEIEKNDYFLTNQNKHWELQKCQNITNDEMIVSFEEEIAMLQTNYYFAFYKINCYKIIASNNNIGDYNIPTNILKILKSNNNIETQIHIKINIPTMDDIESNGGYMPDLFAIDINNNICISIKIK